MAAPPLVNLDSIDLNQVIATREQIYERLPHRYEFMQLDAIVMIDLERRIGVGRRDLREDEFWVRGHIPGRPLFPGVLMLETAAQLASYLTQEVMATPKFIAFGGLDHVKFRASVSPPATMYLIERLIEVRRRRVVGESQGFVDGQLVFEAVITGLPI